MTPKKLNLGSGSRPLPGYTGVDLDPQADLVLDLRHLEGIPDNSVEEIIAIHVIEHFYLWEVTSLLMEWRRVLLPGGKIILECPDLEKASQLFLKGAKDQMGMWAFYGNPTLKNPLHCHKWGYSPSSLEEQLRKAGFKGCVVKEPQFKFKERDMRMEAYK